jgi:hypothetical protein
MNALQAQSDGRGLLARIDPSSAGGDPFVEALQPGLHHVRLCAVVRDKAIHTTKEWVMDWEAITALCQLAGTLAVFATLFFLSGQIRQSNRIGQAEAEREWYAKWHELTRAPMATPEIAMAFRDGLHDYDGLNNGEKAVFSSHLVALLDQLDALRHMHKAGMVSDEFLAPSLRTCKSFINSPGGAQWWLDIGPLMGVYEYLEALPRDDVPPANERFGFFR